MPIIQSRATAAAAKATTAAAVREAEAADPEESQALTQAAVEEGEDSGEAEEPPALVVGLGSKVQRELRAAKIMAAAALLVALLCVGPCAVLASRLAVLSATAPLQPPSSSSTAAAEEPLEGVVGLDEEGPSQAKGWHRTYLKSRVRSGIELDTEEVKVLPAGSLVWVAEVQGRRARVSRPVEGWMSLRSSDGVDILRQDMTYAAPLNSTRLDAMLRSRRLRQDNIKLQEAAAKMTQKQRELMDAIHQLRSKDVVRKVETGTKKAATAAKKKAPEVGRAVAHGAKQVWEKTVRSQKAKEFLKKTFH